MGSITNFYDIPRRPELETPDEVAATIAEFEGEMDRFATEVIRRTQRVRNSD
jgi:hypothetical protein